MELPPFLSDDPMEGNPPSDWADFLSPQLRRFPVPKENIRVKKRIGHGTEGCVVRIRVDNHDERRFALKIFFMSTPEEDNLTWWPFERQARNAAILEKVAVGLRRSFPRPIHVPAKRTTRLDCLRCLYAFSNDGLRYRTFDHLPADQRVAISDGFTHVRKCFGWIRVHGKDFLAINEKIQINRNRNKDELEGSASYLEPDQEYFAIVYEYIPPAKLELVAVQRQLDFFHHIGFHLLQGLAERNWQGPGILLDFGDYNFPADQWYHGRGAFHPCLSAEILVDRAGFRARLRKEANEKEERRRQGIGPTEEEERAEKNRRASGDTATYVEWGYQANPWHTSYFDLTAKMIEKRGLEKDPLAHIQIYEIEPRAMLKAWRAYKKRRVEYLSLMEKLKEEAGRSEAFEHNHEVY